MQYQDYRMDPYDIRLPWTQFTKLYLACNLSIQECTSILDQCLLIESCSFPLVRLPSNTQSPPPIPTFVRNLHHLHLGSLWDMSTFFDSFVFPALIDLHVDNTANKHEQVQHNFIDDWPQANFISLLHRSSCPITHLTLEVDMTETSLIECPQLISSSIEYLSVRGYYGVFLVADRLISLLIHRQIGPEEISCFCPKLCSMHFFNCLSPFELTEGAFADMVESRLSPSLGALCHRQACSPQCQSNSSTYYQVMQND